MIELRQVGFGYPDQPPVLRGVDLVVDDGELVAVAGRTGSGKSTLLATLNGLVPQFTGGTLTGDVLLDGTSVRGRAPRELADVVGYVGQDPVAGFVTDTVEEELAYGMEQLGLPPATMRRRVEETLDLLGLADLRDRALTALSGGQQQRVAIGAVLTMHPRLLVLDEPTSALDPTAAEEVLATLARLVQDVGVAVVLAEHRLERVLPFADRLAWLEDGRLDVGDPADVLGRVPTGPPIVELGRWAGWSPLPLTVRDARRRSAGLRGRLAASPDVPDAVSEPAPGVADDVVAVRGLVTRHGRVPVLREVTCALPAGSVTAVMGRNGAGKSTLLWAVQGSGSRVSGTVTVAGQDTAGASVPVRRELVGLVPQTAADLLYLETVADECATADRAADVAPGSTAALLERLVPGIPGDRHPRDLSEGQRLALVLSLVLVGRPRALLLDEPTRGLDYTAKEQLTGILGGLAAEGLAVAVATHDVEFVARTAQRVLVLADGEVISAGPTERVVTETPAFAPQVAKVLGGPWLTVDEVRAASAARGAS